MGVRIAGRFSGEHEAALFDSVTGRAFGPVFDSHDQAEDFLAWLATNGFPNHAGLMVTDARLLVWMNWLDKAVAAWRDAVDAGEWESVA